MKPYHDQKSAFLNKRLFNIYAQVRALVKDQVERETKWYGKPRLSLDERERLLLEIVGEIVNKLDLYIAVDDKVIFSKFTLDYFDKLKDATKKKEASEVH